MDSARRVISGTFGQLWMDGELVAECSAFQAKYQSNKEDVPLCGQMVVDTKTLSVKGTGSITLYHVYSRFRDKYDQILQGRDVRCTLVGLLDDPDAYGAERVSVQNVSFDDHTLADWAANKLVTTTHPFTFTRHKYLDTIETA